MSSCRSVPILVVCLGLIQGCAERPTERAARSGFVPVGRPDPDAPDWRPSVTDHSLEIAEVRGLSARQYEDDVRRLVAAVCSGSAYFFESLDPFRGREGPVVAKMAQIAADRSASPVARARAAGVVWRLGDRDAGRRFFLDALAAESAALRLESVKVVRELSGGVDLYDPAWSRPILVLIDDPDSEVAAQAAHVAAWRDLLGAEAKIIERLRSRRDSDPSTLAEALARAASTPEAVALVVEHVFRERPTPYRSLRLSLRRLVKWSDPRIAGLAKDAVRSFLLGYQGETRLDSSYVRDLALVADRSTVTVLEEIQAKSADLGSRLEAVEALASIDPRRGVDRLLEFARVEGRSYEIADALRRAARESDAERIIPVVLGPGSSGRTRSVDEPTARLLYERLGRRGREALEAAADRLNPDARMWLLWKKKRLNLGMALDDLHAVGVISRDREALLARMRRQDESAARREIPFPVEPTRFDPQEPSSLTGALVTADCLTGFDAETGEVPCEHHRLLAEQFVQGSGGRFRPECAVQSWLVGDGKDDPHGPYLVRFLFEGRLYRFGAEDRGDWYDVQAVQRGANFALATAGRKERFLALRPDGQVAWFVFADPVAFVPIAEKYGLALSEDADEAMRNGQAFDREVVKRLNR